MVVLDTLKDWRFKHHPFVTGPPDIRFYAGAPLRTTEGYNVGSICIIDNQPRAEFPPRSRMALKEFAGIVVREMELWRDKVRIALASGTNTSCIDDAYPFGNVQTRLKARDRIQTSVSRTASAVRGFNIILILPVLSHRWNDSRENAWKWTMRPRVIPRVQQRLWKRSTNRLPNSSAGHSIWMVRSCSIYRNSNRSS